MNDKAFKKITLLLVVLFLTFGTMIPNKGLVKAASGNTAPEVISIKRHTPLDEKTNATSVTFEVTFSESVTGVQAEDFTLGRTGSTSGTVSGVSGVGTNYLVTVTNINGVGTLRLDLNSTGTGISNAAGLAVAGYTDGEAYTVGLVAPTITTQPSNQTIRAGNSATFTVTATGDAPLSYQWKKDGADIAGATSASLTINNVQVGDAGSYTVVVTNTLGNATSIAATLTVTPAPVVPIITTQPSNQTIIAGGSPIFTVTASGDAPLSYQWKKDGTDIAEATSASLTINNVQVSDAGSYTVVVTNAVGNVTSNTATLTVMPVPVTPKITTHPSNQTIIAGGSATFTVTATSDTSLSYQWKKDGADIAGATRASLTINNVQAGDAGSYAVVVTNAVGNVTSNAAILTVTPAPTPVNPSPGNSDVEIKPTQPAPVNPTPTVPTQPTPSLPTDTVTPPTDNTETKLPVEVPTETPSVEQDLLKLIQLDLPVGLPEGSVVVSINEEGNIVITTTVLNNTRAATITIPVLAENANKVLKIRTANGLEAVAYTIKDGKVVVQLHKAGELVFFDANIDLTDISNNQFRSDIEMLAQRGIFTGDNGKFNPNANMTRAQFAGTLVRALGLNENPETAKSFADVSSSAWYAGSTGTLADLGMMNGDNGVFNPGGKITRQQMFAVVSKLLEAKGIEASNDLTGDFKDASKVSDYAKPYVSILIEIGAISGDNNLLKPQENVTKGQMAKVLAKVLAKIEAL